MQKRIKISLTPRNSFAVVTSILALAFIARLPFLNLPLDGDSGVFTAMGKFIAQGNFLLYRDLFEIKPPGIYFLFALLFKIFPATLLTVNIFSAFWGVLNTFVIYILAKYILGTRRGLLSALIFGIFSSNPQVYGSLPLTENFLITFVMLGFYALVKSIKENKNMYFLSGLLCGTGFLFKQVAVFEIFAALLFMAMIFKLKPASFPKFMLYLMGCAVPILIFAFYFAFKGAFWDFFFCVFTFNGKYVLIGQKRQFALLLNLFDSIVKVLKIMPFLSVTSVIFLISASIKIFCRRLRILSLGKAKIYIIFIIIWFVLSFLGASLSGQRISHYYITIIPPCVIACAYALGYLLRRRARVKGIFFLSLVFALLAFTFLSHGKYYFGSSAEEISRDIFGDAPFIEAYAAGLYLKKHALPTDYVYNWSKEPEIFLYASGRPVSRYLWISLYSAYYKVIPGCIEEVAEALEENPPDYIVVDTRYALWMFQDIYADLRGFFGRHKYVEQESFPVIRGGKEINRLVISRLAKGK